VVSTAVMIMTMIMEMIAASLNVGVPKWNGVVTPNRSASPTWLKSVKLNSAPTAVPTIRPMSTAMVDRKPLKNR
jgi:hypothetical protein